MTKFLVAAFAAFALTTGSASAFECVQHAAFYDNMRVECPQDLDSANDQPVSNDEVRYADMTAEDIEDHEGLAEVEPAPSLKSVLEAKAMRWRIEHKVPVLTAAN